MIPILFAAAVASGWANSGGLPVPGPLRNCPHDLRQAKGTCFIPSGALDVTVISSGIHEREPGHMQTFWNLIKTDHDYVIDKGGNNIARPYTTNMSTFFAKSDCDEQQNRIENTSDKGDGVICVPVRKWVK